MSEIAEDGRVARGNRTRQAVIDAILDLYTEGNLSPTIEQIAGRVGKAPRSIYHHFKDQEALAAAVTRRQLEKHADLFSAQPITGNRSERIGAIASHRAELFEAIAPTRRSARIQMHRSPVLQQNQTRLNAHLRQQVEQTFESELSLLSGSRRAQALDLLDLHTSWESWERLRTLQNLSVKRSRQLTATLIKMVLDEAAS